MMLSQSFRALYSPQQVDIGHCTFLVDSYFPGSQATSLEPDYVLDSKTWKVVQCSDFLDVTKTHVLGRIFYLPAWDVIPARYRRNWGQYCLLQRRTAQV